MNKFTLAANFKNEIMIRYMYGLRVRKDPNDLSEEPMKIAAFTPSIAGDGKAECDLVAANANNKVNKAVRSGMNILNAECQAEALVCGDGIANCVIMLG